MKDTQKLLNNDYQNIWLKSEGQLIQSWIISTNGYTDSAGDLVLEVNTEIIKQPTLQKYSN